MSTSSYTLFVGDLSIYCTKEELESVFSVFGPIRDIRIKTDELTGKNLSYGFIEFESVTSAVNVLTRMNGYVLGGRPMRVRWAANKSKKANETPVFVNTVNSNETSPVHVTYTTLQPNIIVTEESLRWLFSSYGHVIDATVKKSTLTQDQSGRKGYGFVHYPCTQEGIEAAIHAATVMANVVVDGVHYKCCVSKNLENRLNSMPVASPAPTQQDAYSMNCYMYQQHQQQAMRFASAAYQQQMTPMYTAPVAQLQHQQYVPVVQQPQPQPQYYTPPVHYAPVPQQMAYAPQPACQQYVSAPVPVVQQQPYQYTEPVRPVYNHHCYSSHLQASVPVRTPSPRQVAYSPPQYNQHYSQSRSSCPPFRAAPVKRVYSGESQLRVGNEKFVEVTKTSPKSVTLSSSMDALQNKLDDLRMSCGTVAATVTKTAGDVHIDADQLVHCVDVCDY